MEAGLRRFRNREMLRIVWRDLCGLASLGNTFRDLTGLAEACLQAALDAHESRLVEQHGTPRGPDGEPLRLVTVAEVRQDRGPAEVHRLQQQRAAVVSANLEGRSLAGAVGEANPSPASLAPMGPSGSKVSIHTDSPGGMSAALGIL